MKPPKLPTVRIKQRGARRLRAGHPWVYRSDVQDDGGAKSGDVVRVATRHGSGGRNDLGLAFYSRESQIQLRQISQHTSMPDREFWRQRLQCSIARRSDLADADGAVRLVFSEADKLPGLIVDRYADVLVIQTQCAGSDALKKLWVELLCELLSPRAVFERNDTPSRRLEGLAFESGLLSGKLDGPVEVRIGGLSHLVHPLEGQKTGTYLDQQENQVCAAGYSRGRCLDVFSYQGGFGLQLAQGGAEEVTLVDQSERALAAAQQTAERNQLQLSVQAANAFDFLRQQHKASQEYDVVVLDPPAFAKNKASVEGALRGYKEVNLRALRLLADEGILVTSSCSYHLSVDLFEEVLQDAAQDAGRVVQVIERRGQSRDHPERLSFPESRYLKCFVLRVL